MACGGISGGSLEGFCHIPRQELVWQAMADSEGHEAAEVQAIFDMTCVSLGSTSEREPREVAAQRSRRFRCRKCCPSIQFARRRCWCAEAKLLAE